MCGGGLLVTLMGWLWSLSLWALCLACLLRGGRSTTTMDQPPPCLLSSDPHLFLHDLLLTSPSRQVFQPHLPLSPPDYSGIAQLLTATLCYTSPDLSTSVLPLSSPAQVSSSRQLRLTITSLGHTAPQFPTLTPSPSLIQALPNWQLRPTAISCSCSTTPTARQSQHRLEWPPAQRGWQREDWGQPRQPVAVAVNWLCSSSCRQLPQFPLPPPASPWRQRPFSHSGEQAGGEGRV